MTKKADNKKEIDSILDIMKKIEASFYLATSTALNLVERKYPDKERGVAMLKKVDEEYGKLVKVAEEDIPDGYDRLILYAFFCSVTWSIFDRLYREKLAQLGHEVAGRPLMEILGPASDRLN